jgi:hypothetical protein
MTDFRTLALARDIETAFKNHLGTDSLPTREWSDVALEIAKLVTATDVSPSVDSSRREVTENAENLVYRIGNLMHAVSALVGL